MKLKSIFSIFLIAVLIFSCCACTGQTDVTYASEEEVTKAPEPSLNLAVLKNNAASLGLLELMQNSANNENNYNISITENPDEVFELLDSGKADIATLPLISAIRYFNTGKQRIKMLYAASYMTTKVLSTKDDIRSVRDIRSQGVYTPGKYTLETTSVLRLISNHQRYNYLENFTPLLKHADNSNHLLKIIDSGKAEHCIVSEPLATIIMDKHPEFQLAVDVSNSFSETNYSKVIQDCVVITEEYLNDHPEAVETFLTRCKTSIVYSNYNMASAAKLAEQFQITDNADLTMKMIQNSKIIFMNASVTADNNRHFFLNNDNKFMPLNELFSGYLPESNFYYQ